MGFIFSTITALVAFLVALFGADIAGEKKPQIRAIAFLIGVLATLAAIYKLISEFLVVIPAGEVGVVEVLGDVSDRPLRPGVHFVNPFGEVIEFPTRLKDIKETVSATSKEGLDLQLDVSLQYKLNPDQAAQVYENIGEDEREIIISRFRSLIRQITASYEASAIYGEKRQEVSQELREELRQQLTPLGFVIEEALLREVILPESIREAIQAKLAAQQDSERQQFINEKERQAIEFDLEKARKEAERQKIEAQGIADSQRLISQGLTEELLRLKAIEATQELAASDNTKVLVLGSGENGLPLIMQGQ